MGLAVLVAVGSAISTAGCGDPRSAERPTAGRGRSPSVTSLVTGEDTTQLPGLGPRWRSRIPDATRQAIVVFGKDHDSADSMVVLHHKAGGRWTSDANWPGHNGRKGWTAEHRQGDDKTPMGVFTLSDAGGVLPDPGAKLPYRASTAFAPPRHWSKHTWHDFDYVIAVDYNRVRGSSPLDPRRPLGSARGGGIWLHMDHGSGTSACVSLSKRAMLHLLRTVDPELHPVVVMGDRAELAR